MAKEDCIKDELCNGIFDVGCEGSRYWTCKGSMKLAFDTKFDEQSLQWVNTSISTCAWEKDKKGKMIIFSTFTELSLI